MEVLVQHLRVTISAISDGTWKHADAAWTKMSDGKKKPEEKKTSAKSTETKTERIFSRKQFLAHLVYNTKMKPVFLGPVKLQEKLQLIRNMLVNSLRKFPYKKTTPLVVAQFGEAYVDVADSGVNEIVAPPTRGRPRKRPAAPVPQAATRNIAQVSSVDIHFLLGTLSGKPDRSSAMERPPYQLM